MKRISCEYNIDNACVEIKYDNGVKISIDCITVENTIPRNMYEHSELDYLVYHDPAAYADLVLSGGIYEYLRKYTDYKPLD